MEDMQLVGQTPNVYHQMQIDRTDRSQPQNDRNKALEGELIPPGMASASASKAADPSGLQSPRPVEATGNDPLRQDRGSEEDGPGTILDLMA
jgi:hypothetical protein